MFGLQLPPHSIGSTHAFVFCERRCPTGPFRCFWRTKMH